MGQIFQMNSCSLAEYNKIVTPQEEIGIFFHYHLTTKYCKQIQEISEISVLVDMKVDTFF